MTVQKFKPRGGSATEEQQSGDILTPSNEPLDNDKEQSAQICYRGAPQDSENLLGRVLAAIVACDDPPKSVFLDQEMNPTVTGNIYPIDVCEATIAITETQNPNRRQQHVKGQRSPRSKNRHEETSCLCSWENEGVHGSGHVPLTKRGPDKLLTRSQRYDQETHGHSGVTMSFDDLGSFVDEGETPRAVGDRTFSAKDTASEDRMVKKSNRAYGVRKKVGHAEVEGHRVVGAARNSAAIKS
ncbi:hypothetical protein WN55_04885 [Dufourea novaeangliae]|uniref:Uncharacterized protein n=1 Tax=Dufourea novaeangliae TaxID=178035 RepID=A0A154PP05_DUFNO|nr:hypothetical protein WN55_04885 [Dufourea novaeangliae]